MIHVVFGETGTGKSRRLIEMANDSLDGAKGTLVFVSYDDQYMYGLKRNIRFIDASEYCISDPKMLFGFVAGIAAQDFDLEKIYIDELSKIARQPSETFETFFAELEAFSNKREIEIVISMSGERDTAPAFMAKYAF